MLAEEYNLNYLSILKWSCLQTEVTQKPTLHKDFKVVCQSFIAVKKKISVYESKKS